MAELSILTGTKRLLGINEEDESFDLELIMNINSVFMILNQLGLGPTEGYSIDGPENNWTEFISDYKNLQLIKTYMYMKVRLMFDPPQIGHLADSIKKQCDEFEWRLNVQVENKNTQEEQ